MSVFDQNAPETGGEEAPPQMTELDMLKARAKLMGITHSPNIGVDALKAKIQAKVDGVTEEGEKEPEVIAQVSPELTQTASPPLSQAQATAAPQVVLTPAQLLDQKRKAMLAENMKLIRCRITNMDPKKKDLPGELFAVGNDVMGVVRKFIPYGEVTDNGYHIPYILYKALIKRKFLDIKVTKNSKGQENVVQRWVKEFSIDILPPLTQGEIAKLAASQAAAGGVE